MFNRIILGTANFSKEYNGTKVKDPDSILQYCLDKKIWAIDTATEYGTHNLEYPKKIVKVQKDDVLFGKPPHIIMAHGVGAYERTISLCNEKGSYLGVSVYPDELDKLQAYGRRPSVIQLPYSVFDRRMESYFVSIKQARIQIQARSVFLRGRVFEKTTPFKALAFVLMNQHIDKVVIGTESLQMLQDTLDPFEELDNLKIEDEEVIDPRKWSKK